MIDLTYTAYLVIMLIAAWSWLQTLRSHQKEEKNLLKWELLYWEGKELKSYIIQAPDYDSARDKSEEFLTRKRTDCPDVRYAGLFKMVNQKN